MDFTYFGTIIVYTLISFTHNLFELHSCWLLHVLVIHFLVLYVDSSFLTFALFPWIISLTICSIFIVLGFFSEDYNHMFDHLGLPSISHFLANIYLFIYFHFILLVFVSFILYVPYFIFCSIYSSSCPFNFILISLVILSFSSNSSLSSASLCFIPSCCLHHLFPKCLYFLLWFSIIGGGLLLMFLKFTVKYLVTVFICSMATFLWWVFFVLWWILLFYIYFFFYILKNRLCTDVGQLFLLLPFLPSLVLPPSLHLLPLSPFISSFIRHWISWFSRSITIFKSFKYVFMGRRSGDKLS